MLSIVFAPDFSNKIGRSKSWLNSEAKSTISSPSGGGSTVIPYEDDKLDGERYFVVGCFGSAGYSEFSAKGKAASSISFADCQ